MALGIDIYRYQTVTDPEAVKRDGVSFAYVKGSDGGGPAIVRADNQVRQMKKVGIPVGLYHYAQFSPSPEAQARVLHSEVARLGATGLPPALDLESPFSANLTAKDFAIRFLRELKNLGYAKVTLYANTSMLTGIQAADIRLQIPGLLVWEANYGANTGSRRVLPNRAWRTDIHQFTSVGRVPGISGNVDLNESFTDPTSSGVVDELSWTDKSGVKSANDPNYEYSYGELVVGSNVKDNENHDLLVALAEQVAELKAAMDAPRPVSLTDADRAALRVGLAKEVADELHGRLET